MNGKQKAKIEKAAQAAYEEAMGKYERPVVSWKRLDQDSQTVWRHMVRYRPFCRKIPR